MSGTAGTGGKTPARAQDRRDGPRWLHRTEREPTEKATNELRIAMVTSRYPCGGGGQVPMLLIQGMEDRHEMFFITGGEEDRAEHVEGKHRRVVLGMPPRHRFWHHYCNPSLVRKLRVELARIRPDIVHLHSTHNRTFPAAALLLSRDYPMVWSLHDVWSQCVWGEPRPSLCEGMMTGCRWCPRMPGLSLVNRWVKEYYWRRADIHVVLCCEWMKRFLVHSALGRKPTEVIPNGVETKRLGDLHGREVRSRLGIPSSACVVLFVGNMLLPRKGHQEVLHVARRIVADTEDVWFLFVGHHHEDEKDTHPRILITGPVDPEEIPDHYDAGDIFVFPGHVEYAPLVILEAMAAGLPQVACRVGGIPEQVVDGTTGLLVEKGDEADLERQIRKLLTDETLRRSMGEASRKRVQELFSLSRQVSLTVELYERVIAERRSRGPDRIGGRPGGTVEAADPETPSVLTRPGPLPLVSIVMPAYNTGRFIRQTIDSVLAQTYDNWELLITDDGSTDDTPDVIAGYDDPRIRCFHTENRGPSAARNNSLDHARGEFIALLDCDDIWLSEKLAVQVRLMQEQPDVGLTYSNVLRISEDGRRLGIHRLALSRMPDGSCLHQLLVRNVILTCSAVMLRASVLGKTGTFDERLLGTDDWDLWWRVAVYSRFRYFPRPLVAYRVRPGSLSNVYATMNRGELAVLERAYSHPEVRRRVASGHLARLRRKAAAVRFYDAGWRAMLTGDLDRAAANLFESIRSAVYDFRQMVMLTAILAMRLPFVSRKFLLKVMKKGDWEPGAPSTKGTGIPRKRYESKHPE